MQEGRRLDPQDWDGFRRDFHALLDACLDRLEAARDLPWVPPPANMAARVAIGGQGAPAGRVFDRMVAEILPYGTGNTHPRFWGWVHGTGLPVAVAAEMVAATMNANLGGRHHGAMAVEHAVIDWLARLAGMPGASGLLTAGTSQATVLALGAARMRAFPEVRRHGLAGLPPLRVYAAEGAHACVSKALEVMGHGSEALCRVPLRAGAMDPEALAQAVARDRSNGIQPLAVVGTAGSVNTGTFDPFPRLADFCAEQRIWLHADAAFGFWTRLAEAPWQSLTQGIERADSIATDFHKWIGVPYDCGACLVADAELHRRTFAARPDYLAGRAEGLAGGETWFCDYGIDLSRGFRALKVWAAVETLGETALGAAITDNCRQAALMGRLAEASEWLELAQPVVSNLCCMVPKRGEAGAIAARLQLSGEAVFSTTVLEGRTCLRAAIVNHRTTEADVRAAVRAVEREVQAA
jgi:glutamate/tyrosine decarboxylase-like PLP-dependent enzyme